MVGDTSGVNGNGWESAKNHPSSIHIVSSVSYQSTSYPVTIISSRAFFRTSGVTSINIPEGIQQIGYNAFDQLYMQLTELKIPNSVTFIDYYAFATNYISQVFIGTGLAIVGEYGIFANNPPLMKIIVDDENPNFCNDEQFALYSKNKTILYQATSFSKHFIIPSTVNTVKSKAFDGFLIESIRTSSNISSFSTLSIYRMPKLSVIYLLSEIPETPTNIIYLAPNLRYIYYYAKTPSSHTFTYECPSIKKVYVVDPEFKIINGMSTTLHYYQYCFTCKVNNPKQGNYVIAVMVFILL